MTGPDLNPNRAGFDGQTALLLDAITLAAANAHGVTTADILSRSRKREVSRARSLAVAMSDATVLEVKQERIADWFRITRGSLTYHNQRWAARTHVMAGDWYDVATTLRGQGWSQVPVTHSQLSYRPELQRPRRLAE